VPLALTNVCFEGKIGHDAARKALLQSLAERGFGQEQLSEISRMIDAEKSDDCLLQRDLLGSKSSLMEVGHVEGG
jgi:hypothetical protein